mmetsp:Transcript_3754/g.10950  ORF Transcript_3754/g.10950 Transcript_3754/m.10950 type:complete len:206 (+) Transcript_3754:351-968(+)
MPLWGCQCSVLDALPQGLALHLPYSLHPRGLPPHHLTHSSQDWRSSAAGSQYMLPANVCVLLRLLSSLGLGPSALLPLLQNAVTICLQDTPTCGRGSTEHVGNILVDRPGLGNLLLQILVCLFLILIQLCLPPLSVLGQGNSLQLFLRIPLPCSLADILHPFQSQLSRLQQGILLVIPSLGPVLQLLFSNGLPAGLHGTAAQLPA